MNKKILFAPLAIVIGLASFLLLWRLGNTTLTNWDEAWFASVARDGNWNGQAWFYEPPAVTLILSGVMRLFGVDELWLRLPFAIFGVGIVWLTCKLAQKNNYLAATLSGLVLIADIEFLFRSRQINTDVPLTFFLLLSLYAWLNGWVRTGWVAWGLAFLSKRATPLLLFPVLMLIWWQDRKKTKKPWLMGLILFGLIVVSWHGYMYVNYGGEFIQKYVLGFTIGKITSINPVTGTDPVTYVLALKHAFKLFFLVLPVALMWVIKQFKSWKVVLAMIITFFGALTLAPIKASWYLLPIHPLVAIIIGSFLAAAIKRLPLLNLQLVALMLICMVVGFQLLYWSDDYIVPNTTNHQANISRLVGSLAQKGEVIYLDDDYLPVAVFYSGRQVVPLRFNRLPIQRDIWLGVNSYVLTNRVNFYELSGFLPAYAEMAKQQDLLLVKVQQ